MTGFLALQKNVDISREFQILLKEAQSIEVFDKSFVMLEKYSIIEQRYSLGGEEPVLVMFFEDELYDKLQETDEFGYLDSSMHELFIFEN